ncbi:MAG: hypothetical protein XE10_2097 [Methanoculleus marisnigri]|uniref:Uncharacterized protein n=1 Tax=Methanoculleus marisnigri TaxID=2198 RepID=A0A117LPE6_9EURY|nr:MAG: hypothetical protein XD82_1758 [Methanoculleus marisnigri]KUK98335.1 MAG: hypothetical protein XE10_2097 [Methanoculleus marisnigri]
MTGGGFGYCNPAARRQWPPVWGPIGGYRVPYSPYPGPVYGLGRGGAATGWRPWPRLRWGTGPRMAVLVATG